MKYRIGRLKVRAGFIAWLAAALAAGFCIEFAQDAAQRAMASMSLALIALAGMISLVRGRSARRWQAAVDACAEREIAEAQRQRPMSRMAV